MLRLKNEETESPPGCGRKAELADQPSVISASRSFSE